jgi:hypothetical protein
MSVRVRFYLSIVFSDLPSPTEASNERAKVGGASRRRETGVHPRIKSEGKLFGIVL